MTKDIFISYRRSDSSDVTGRITDHVTSHFGPSRFFKDVDSIPMGDDFRAAISDAVASSKVMLAIIGPDWLTVTTETGERRINDPDDYVQLEIASALRHGVPVIPVLVEQAEMPKPWELPRPLHDLAYRNATSVRADPDFRTDIARLFHQVQEFVSPDITAAARRRPLIPFLAVVLLLGLAGAAVAFFVTGRTRGAGDGGETEAAKGAGAATGAGTATESGSEEGVLQPVAPVVMGSRLEFEISPREGAEDVTFVNETVDVLRIRTYNASDTIYLIARKMLVVDPGESVRWARPPPVFRVRVALEREPEALLGMRTKVKSGSRVVLRYAAR